MGQGSAVPSGVKISKFAVRMPSTSCGRLSAGGGWDVAAVQAVADVGR